MEAASSPMMSPASALTLTSVEINDHVVNTTDIRATSVNDIANTSTFAGDAQWVKTSKFFLWLNWIKKKLVKIQEFFASGCKLDVKVRNMKMDFNIYGTWHSGLPLS